MSLNYSIVWIDDTPDWVNSINAPILDHSRESGIVLNITYRETITPENVVPLLVDQNVDLLVVDFNLPDMNGNQVIELVRSYGELTEIVFYSQDNAHDGVIEAADGIHSISRDDAEDTIKRVLESFSVRMKSISAMRGMIIAEAIDIENQLTKIIKRLFADKGDLFQDKVLDEKRLDFYAKYRFVQSCLNDKIQGVVTANQNDPALVKLRECKEILNDFSDEVIDQRNILAHSEKTFRDGVLVLKGLNKRTDEIKFDNDWRNNVRLNFRKHRANLKELNLLI